ncbi:hypothetical protein PTT_12121 [Pyrenophora teres f. teres 0-1]|uniref:Uncharacterized protein n=1 Tax=Pyrenophora teres f. teres (strain 0-1) TaxID=861557 RepID=E3RT18_PYRTT|nr:hypothetical protein PTT_12121 [Pyrenophora teres f. teres 0-1]
MSDTGISHTLVCEQMDEVTQSSLINICISDEILREIDITVEPSPDGRININIARRQQRIPDHQSDSLSMDYYSSPEVYINRPAITAWAVDVATHTADLDLIEHIEQMYEYYTAQSYEYEISSSEGAENSSSDEQLDPCATCGLSLGQCDNRCRCSLPFVSPLTTPLLGPMGTPEISPLSSPRLINAGT